MAPIRRGPEHPPRVFGPVCSVFALNVSASTAYVLNSLHSRDLRAASMKLPPGNFIDAEVSSGVKESFTLNRLRDCTESGLLDTGHNVFGALQRVYARATWKHL
jgi:hypothetical protein